MDSGTTEPLEYWRHVSTVFGRYMLNHGLSKDCPWLKLLKSGGANYAPIAIGLFNKVRSGFKTSQS